MHISRMLIATACAVLVSACVPSPNTSASNIKRGQLVFAKECSQCHGARGEGGGIAPSGMGVVPPDLTLLSQRSGGVFPREYVSRFIMGQLERVEPNSPMPDFASVGLKHVYPNGGADGEVLEADFEDLQDYLESIQK